MTVERDDRVIEGSCGLACFDLLGFRSRVYAHAQYHYASGIDGLSILAGEYIEKAINTIEEELTYQSQFSRMPWYYAHFSDTFILYVPDDSRDSFETLDSAGGSFFHKRVLAGKPLRGALTWGRFYADRARSIFLGPALIDAYEYAEKQDWIGYILTPQAVKRLSDVGFRVMPPGNYVEWEVPVKIEKTIRPCGRKITTVETERLFAFKIGGSLSTRESIHNMKKKVRNESKEEAENESKKVGNESRETPNEWRDIYKRCRSKYINTLLFMKHARG